MGVIITEGTPVVAGAYGSLAGVQAYLAPTITLTTSTKVTTTDVTDALATLATTLDMRLAAAGYLTPVMAADALVILDMCANLLVAADALERLMVSRDPTTEKVSVAEVWRKQAEEILALIFEGTVRLTGAARATSGGVRDTPGVSSTASAFPIANTTDFVDSWGDTFSGGGS